MVKRVTMPLEDDTSTKITKKRKKSPKVEVIDDECVGHFELISDSGVRV